MVLFFLRLKRMRKCRNWQTSKTKDLVSIALVWVQVPSSAFCFSKWKSLRLPFYVYKQISIMQLWRNWHTRMIQVHVRVNWVWVQVPSTASKILKSCSVILLLLRIFCLLKAILQPNSLYLPPKRRQCLPKDTKKGCYAGTFSNQRNSSYLLFIHLFSLYPLLLKWFLLPLFL